MSEEETGYDPGEIGPNVLDNPIYALGRFVRAHTIQVRKGEVMSTRRVGSMQVTTIDAMPSIEEVEAESAQSLIDVGFFLVGFSAPAAEGEQQQLLELLRAALDGPGEWQAISRDRFLQSLSYIDVGAWIGDQGLAMCLYGLLEHYELGSVVTPARLGVTDEEQAHRAMGNGFVLFAPSQALQEALA